MSAYVRGAVGAIERICGADGVPGSDRPDELAAVYTVEFSSVELWGGHDEPAFSVLVDLWETDLVSGEEGPP